MALTNVPYKRQTDAQALEIRAFHTTALRPSKRYSIGLDKA